jgi:hypothetical protein
MSLPSSSTFNSESRSPSPTFGSVGTGIWTVFWLVAFDVLINFAFAYPPDPKITNPSRLQSYFDYGRSTEAKLARMTRPDGSQTAPITLSGWYDPLRVDDHGPVQKPTVTIYGMSHAVRLGLALTRVSNEFSTRIVGAPGATTNWAYGAYLRDHGGGKSSVVVLAFMAANFPMITTMSPMTWNIDAPIPYTADRFYLNNGKLAVHSPPYMSFEQYVQSFYDRAKWDASLESFAQHDSMYNSLIMKSSLFDHSSLYRLVRRAYGQRFLRNAAGAVLSQTGFRSNAEQIKVAQAMIHEFALQAREDKMVPVIFLINNLGYSDYLFQALRPALEADNVPYLSSHQVVSPDDPRGYLPDSHFTDEVDDRLAGTLIKLMKSHM